MSEKKRYQIQGQVVEVLEAGEGNAPSVFFVHGGAGDARFHWSALFSLLKEGLHVVAPDLPGFGGSAPLTQMSTQKLVTWMHEVYTALGLEKVIIIGTGLGATLARLFAAHYPDCVSGLVMLNGGSIPNPPVVMRYLAKTPVIKTLLFQSLARSSTSQSHYAKNIFEDNFKTFTEQFFIDSQASQAAFAALMQALISSPRPEHVTPTCPTVLFWGASDQVNTLTEGRRIQRAIPQSTLTELANCGQLPEIEAPDVLYWQLKQFIKAQDEPHKQRNLPGVQRLGG